MPKPKFPYAGDAALKWLLERHRCPAPFHVVRMRFWGEIVSPSLQTSPIKTIESLWPNGLPTGLDEPMEQRRSVSGWIAEAAEDRKN